MLHAQEKAQVFPEGRKPRVNFSIKKNLKKNYTFQVEKQVSQNRDCIGVGATDLDYGT